MQPPGAGMGQLVMMALIILVFYFLLVRPQQRKQKEHQAMVDALKKNDRVVTSGGLHGRIIEVSGSVVTLEIAKGVSVRQEKSQLGSVVSDRKED
ncbi:MAG: preprotein translocase subunit YajC [Myxococcales bacterium]|nr:MAG: preprotein translocase subunit YajC [Myxococcales bacterium]